MPPERRRENGVGREEGRRSVSALYHELLRCKHQFARNDQFSEFHIFAPQNAAPWKILPGTNAPLAPLPPHWLCHIKCDHPACVWTDGGHFENIQCESKNPPWNFLTFFPTQLGIFSPNFTHPLYVPIYAGLQIFIRLYATLTKLCHIKRDHHNVPKMSTIDWNARWVVTLNMA